MNQNKPLLIRIKPRWEQDKLEESPHYVILKYLNNIGAANRDTIKHVLSGSYSGDDFFRYEIYTIERLKYLFSAVRGMDIDFNNAAGFVGRSAVNSEAQYVVHYLSHAMLFCAGALVEQHVVVTPASCVVGENYKFTVSGGTHKFLEYMGTKRLVENICVHRGYNHTNRWEKCATDNIALLVLNEPFSFRAREKNADFIISRIRYGRPLDASIPPPVEDGTLAKCSFYGWGSRRNGYLVPLLITLRRVDVVIMSKDNCDQMWNLDNKYLCLHYAPCRSEKFGSLCPDDIGSVIECNGVLRGMMVSMLVDRLCGIGFLDVSLYNKFLTCGVDDARDVMDSDSYMHLELHTKKPKATLVTIDYSEQQELHHAHEHDHGQENNGTVSVEETTLPILGFK